MRAARDVVDEEGPVGCGRIEPSHVRDGFVREVGGEVIAGLADPGKHLSRVLEEVRRPLVGLAAHEAVEIVEAHAHGPLVDRAGRAVLIARGVVILPEPRTWRTRSSSGWSRSSRFRGRLPSRSPDSPSTAPRLSRIRPNGDSVR